MKRYLERIWWRIWMQFRYSCFDLHPYHPCIIVMVDGGLCSQMHQYLLGASMRKEGFLVKYDASWYKKYGKDIDGVEAREFELLKAFPHLEFIEASREERRFYIKNYFYGDDIESQDFKKKVPPKYLGGYYDMTEDFESLLKEIFLPYMNLDVLQHENKLMLQKIHAHGGAVGVHVRRGDMAQTGYYWKVLTPDYFAKSIHLLQNKVKKAHFFFFSNDLAWVEHEVLPLLDSSIDFTLVDINGADRVYCDFFLLTACKHQIASQGTMGKYAGLLNANIQKIIISPDTDLESF